MLVKLLPKRQSLVCEPGGVTSIASPALQYEHIHLLFSKTIDWNLIETMLPEMLPVTETEYPETQALIQVYRVGQLSPFDHTYHFTIGGTYELPFGRNKMFNFGGSRLMDELLGGFVLNAIYQFQTGPPIFFSAERDRSGSRVATWAFHRTIKSNCVKHLP